MITQGIFDFLRDVVVNWVSGAASLVSGVDFVGIGSGVGSAVSGAGAFLALFISPGLWGGVVALFGVFLAVYLSTALIAVVGRRGASK